ncbi:MULTISPECIES: AraC family transcriptional regulator [unclassified Breznakia]|uniref:AraC family transcriptional regulator n=1 Tax=unclassified Breznakia TaxID=2623764 RepID=UPI002475F3FB|nr:MULTISPECIES: AraC family transcriptional regulator [unclassified Breznakia]MDH6367979.1 AraC-like DNA-binding protein [Breznakia sp. PH1-1]MDH6405067.1 AraC-like DNA-binding protein [Breznakia sp. PF1-11]MDH6412764.1 AraC-like DNA-binding protein [Breznakia sp. PFB1-11]MDH6415142.1 AraC-like DNA-binding protein [Breznakia sp. PFB1-14]MDH6417435.1 AraC-like DNA-binding protein [Breznakia sp. PFB1-4]
MNKIELDKLLHSHTEQETYYLEHPNALSPRYTSMKKTFINGKEVLNFSLPKLMEQEILIRKDSRYTFVPFYTHTNINMNYIYSGECTYLIDDTYITLKKGDVCIFDKDVVRSKMKTGENDIVINISISNDFFSKGVINNIGEQSIIANFIVNALSNYEKHNHYLIFRTNASTKIISLFESILLEYFQNELYSKEIMNAYLNITFMELLRLYQMDPQNHYIQLSEQSPLNIIDILHYIENNYVDASLIDLSKRLGYHPKYLSTYIHKKTGKTFKQIQLDQRLKTACVFLMNTTQTIEEIASSVGINNLNFFYKKFREVYQLSPNEFRLKQEY